MIKKNLELTTYESSIKEIYYENMKIIYDYEEFNKEVI